MWTSQHSLDHKLQPKEETKKLKNKRRRKRDQRWIYTNAKIKKIKKQYLNFFI